MKTKKLHAGHIELAVVMLMNYRVYTIVPNVSYGLMLGHECDLLMLDNNGRFTEIEIKISAADLKADFKKRHGHRSDFISKLIYAMPKELCEKYKDLVPKHCGIISVEVSYPEWMYDGGAMVKAKHYRIAKHDKTKRMPTEKEKMDFMRLGCMRIWSLKAHNNKQLIKAD
jgi:hypothetical protein